jgi:hypothetical protein
MRLLGTIVLLLSFLVGSAAVAAPSDPAATTAPGVTARWSTKHLFEVGYASTPSPVPLLQLHSWTLTITDAGGRPVDGATITVEGGMPAHAHGLPTTPQVKGLGQGRYLVEGLKFHMPGAWVVGFRVKAGAVVDAVKFDLQLD